MANASVVFTTARSLMNDQGDFLWHDSILQPFLVQAYRELEDELQASDAPVMKSIEVLTIGASVTSFSTLPSGRVLISPIRIYERPQSDPDDSTYSLMTEWNPLPFQSIGNLRNWWTWDGTSVQFNQAAATSFLKTEAWARLTEPVDGTSDLVIPQAEDYLSPRTAALAGKSVGENARHDTYTALAQATLADIIRANHGRMKANPKP